MKIQKPSQRRVLIAILLTVIAVASGSTLRTAVEREVISPAAVVQFWATVSPFPANREYYRIKARHIALQDDIRSMLAGAENDKTRLVVQELKNRQAALRRDLTAFLDEHPSHVLALIASADLHAECGNRIGSLDDLARAAELSPGDVEIWTELATRSVRFGEMRRAFPAFERALEIEPEDLALLRDYSNSLFVYRKDAMHHYNINEAETFDRSMRVILKARDLYPQNIDLAYDIGMSYYSIRPSRNEEAVEAWKHVQKISRNEFERQTASLHIARFLLKSGDLSEAGHVLAEVTHPGHALHKGRVTRLLAGVTDDEDQIPTVRASFTTP